MGYSAEGQEIKNQTVLSETFGSQPGGGRLPSGLIRHLFVFLERMIQTATKTTRDAIQTTIRQRRTSNQISFFPTHNHSAMTALTERDAKNDAPCLYVHSCLCSDPQSERVVVEVHVAQAVLGFLFGCAGLCVGVVAVAVLVGVAVPVSECSAEAAAAVGSPASFFRIPCSALRSGITASKSLSLSCFALFFNRCLLFSALRSSLVILIFSSRARFCSAFKAWISVKMFFSFAAATAPMADPPSPLDPGRPPTSARGGASASAGACPPAGARVSVAVGSPPLSESSEARWEAGSSAVGAAAATASSTRDMLDRAELGRVQEGGCQST